MMSVPQEVRDEAHVEFIDVGMGFRASIAMKLISFCLGLMLAFGPVAQQVWAAQEEADSSVFGEFEDEFGDDEMDDPAYDPLEGYNRFMFQVNDKFYYYLAKPVARGYAFVVPQPGRVALGRAFHNLDFPVRFVNSLLQLKFKKTGVELGRFVVNSSAGLGGLFDPADHFLEWRRPGDEDFGQTLGRYGVGGGFPIVLPILGPSNVRDGIGIVPDSFANPVDYVVGYWWVNLCLAGGETLNYLSLHLGEYESIKNDALDPYAFIRDAYEENRNKKIAE